MTAITIHLLGVLQQWVKAPTISLNATLPSQPSVLKQLLAEKFKGEGVEADKLTLLAHCVFADDQHIFSEDEVIVGVQQLAILPPFSGG